VYRAFFFDEQGEMLCLCIKKKEARFQNTPSAEAERTEGKKKNTGCKQQTDPSELK
jgi:hypothetical protein